MCSPAVQLELQKKMVARSSRAPVGALCSPFLKQSLDQFVPMTEINERFRA